MGNHVQMLMSRPFVSVHGISAFADRSALARSGGVAATVPAVKRLMSSGSSEEKFIYISKFEASAKSLATGSLAQLGLCALMAGLVTFHPAAANSAALPGWTMGGRAMLGSGVVGFGASVVFGLKGFVEKHVLRISVSPDAPGMLKVYVAGFPFGQTERMVKEEEFYAITAAYEAFDLDKEAKGKAPLVPVYVGGKEPGTYIMDLRGDFLDKAACEAVLTYKEPSKP